MNLKMHIKSIHENVRYNCEKCDKNFSNKITLKRHIVNVHEKAGKSKSLQTSSLSPLGEHTNINVDPEIKEEILDC